MVRDAVAGYPIPDCPFYSILNKHVISAHLRFWIRHDSIKDLNIDVSFEPILV